MFECNFLKKELVSISSAALESSIYPNNIQNYIN
jgi:hypothetical protein